MQSGEALTVKQLLDAARDGDAAKVSKLLSTQGAQSLINYQARCRKKKNAAITEQLLAARCNIDLHTVEMEGGLTALQLAQGHLRAGITTLIRNTSRQSEEEERRRKEEENRQKEEEERRQKETRR